MSGGARSHALRGRLALQFEEVFTAIARIRDHRQIPSDLNAFRTHIKSMLVSADQESRRMGYPAEFVRASVYGAVALLDESMHATGDAIAMQWAARPLQDEIFGDNIAGEAFYEQVDDLLRRQDSAYVVDALEVQLLCLALGFRGRYAADDSPERRTLQAAIREKILRVRGGLPPLSPQPLPPPDEVVEQRVDPVQRPLAISVVVAAAVLLFTLVVIRLFSVQPGIGRVRDAVTAIGL